MQVRRPSILDVDEICRIMVSTDPYITLGYSRDMCIDISISSIEEGWAYVAELEGSVVGFVLFRVFDGFPLGGYIRAIAVDERYRGRGIGRLLMDAAERDIFRYRGNSFLLVSGFNYRAVKFYRSLGYEIVGEIRDAIIEDESEFIMRKRRGG
ncbi:MAG: GNAT family N-acetyltransferase [Sulfolobales archaeon]